MTETFRAVLLPLWPALVAALVLGLLFGWFIWREEAAGFLGRLGLILALVAVGGATALVVLGRVPGRPGLRLETGLAILLAYLAGSILGSLARRVRIRFMARPAVGPGA